MSKTFLFPVLAIAALGLPAWGDVTTYCNSGCGADTASQFVTDAGTDEYTLQGLAAFVSSNLVGSIYTDPTTGITFADFENHPLTISAGALTTGSNQGDTILITIPSTYLAIVFTATEPGANADLCISPGPCPATGEASGVVGFINPDPGGSWSVSVGPGGAQSAIQITNFSEGTAEMGDMGGGSSTPEVGTLLLIGAGLISMRWMKRWPRKVFRTLQPA
jgi:hypothetical protein